MLSGLDIVRIHFVIALVGVACGAN
jgi:hypothetical protein